MLTKLSLYALFAVFAIVANLGAQRVVLDVAGSQGPWFLVALVVGTGIGLVIKYALDKVYIFEAPVTHVAGEARQFVLYSLSGVVTTLIFWGSETGSWLLTRSHFWREVGAIIGLTVGYTIKYMIDRRVVFEGARYR